MKAVQRGELFGLYMGDAVTVIGLPDDPRDLNATCEVELCGPTEPKKMTVRWGDVQDLSGSGRHPPWLESR